VRVVPEHVAKATLAARGIRVPQGVVLDQRSDPAGWSQRAAALVAPLVVKAFGPAIVHKSDVGAVALGIEHDDLRASIEAMDASLASCGIEPAGYLVEEQEAPGLELLVGVVRRPPFGLAAAIGLGGVLAEVLDEVDFRLLPLGEQDIEELLDAGPWGPTMDGTRGRPKLDRGSVAELLRVLGGHDGVALSAGDDLEAIECNPVVVSEHGAVVLDARLLLADQAAPAEPSPPPTGERTDLTALFEPRHVVVAGASTKRPGFGNRALAAYRDVGRTDVDLHVLHPSAAAVDGVRAVRSVHEVGGPVDYLLVAVPASGCAAVVRDAAGSVPFVQIVSGGFDELGESGRALSLDLAQVAAETSCRIVGPNSIGVYSPSGRQAFQVGDPIEPGPVSFVSQSGGLGGDVVKAGAARGLRFAKVITLGNAVDLGPGEVIDWLVDDPASRIIGAYIESAGDAAAVIAALRRARGRVPVAVLLGGQSDQGAQAAASHTGALAGSRKMWGAVEAATGAVFVTTLEQLLAVLSYQHLVGGRGSAPGGDGSVLVVGVGGGASVLAADACARAGLRTTATSPSARARLADVGHGVGTSAANPVEIPFGPLVETGALPDAVHAVTQVDRFQDVLVHVNVQAYYSYGDRGLAPVVDQLRGLTESRFSGLRIGVVLRNRECAPLGEAERIQGELVGLGIPCFRDFDEAATAMAAAQRFASAGRLS
jgi:acyl-CoA synthetase (NDP forming)